jgi:hypothetical protein
MQQNETGTMNIMGQYTDADFRRTMLSALRLLAILTVIAAVVLWVKLGWQSALLLAVGSLISGSGLWEWLRLLTAAMARMDADPDGQANAMPMGRVLVNFFVRLVLAGGLLYVSLKFLNGSVYALAVGLALGGFCLMVEGIRLIQAWTS